MTTSVILTAVLLALAIAKTNGACKVTVDYVLLVDGSSSVTSSGRKATGDPNYYKNNVFKLLKQIINKFDVGEAQSHIGVIFYGNKDIAKIKQDGWYFGLDEFYDKPSMAKWFDDKPQAPLFGATYTGVGAKEAKLILDASSRKADKTVAKGILLLTDGYATDTTTADKEFAAIKRNDVTIVTMGIGKTIDTIALKRWATEAKYFIQAGFTELESAIDKIQAAMCEAAVEVTPTAVDPPAPPENNYCQIKYPGASFCWLFDKIVEGTKTQDYIGMRFATLYYGAAISKSVIHGYFLTLSNANLAEYGENKYPWVDMGDFTGTCVSDPDLCSNGISVVFWLRMTTAMITEMSNLGMTHQYILSSGGQKSDSRGFALLYQKDASFEGFKLQLQASNMDYVIEMTIIPTGWFFVAFTWIAQEGMGAGASGGLYYYQNGKQVGTAGTPVKGSYPLDKQTHLTIGKPNYGDKYFGRFQMDNFVIYYKVLTVTEISSLWGGGALNPGGAAAAGGTTITSGGSTTTTTTTGGGSITTGGGSITTGGGSITTGGGSVTTGGGSTTITTTSGGSEYVISNKIYEFSRWFWAFKSVVTLATGQTISYLQQKDDKHNALFGGGVKLFGSTLRGQVLWLQTFGSYVLLGDFAYTCVSDPDRCSSSTEGESTGKLTSGLTISFWLKITSNDLKIKADDKDQQHQYIISSGGQVSNSRGFSFLYASEEKKFKLQLQTKKYVYMIEFDNLQETWVHIAFTWKTEGQLVLYINGQVEDTKDKQEKVFDSDTHTKLTIGKPNHIDKHFGRFKMDLLAIFYYQLSANQILGLSGPREEQREYTPEETTVVVATTASPMTVTTAIPGGGDAGTTAVVATTAATLVTTPSALITTIKPATQPATPVPPTDKPNQVCTAKIDLVIVIDNSGSIEARGRDGYFEQIKMFIKNMMKLFKLGNANIAIIEASSDARIIAKFGEVKDQVTFDQYINNLNYKRERSFLGKALELVRTDVFAKILCKQSAKLMFVVTDGYASDDVTLPGIELRDMGVVMLGIGYGPETQLMRYTLESLSSDPKDQFTFLFGYDRLIESVQQIVKKACDAAVEASTIDTTDLVNNNPIKGAVGTEFINYFMNEINKYRRMHSAIPVTWSVELSMKAQQWAEYLAGEDRLLTKPRVHYGQTLYISPKPGPIAAQIAVRAWYNQIIYFNFQKPRISELNSYFVQLVWRSTTDIGVGKYQSASGKTYVVAFYNPVGNSDDGLTFNLLAMTSSAVTGVKTGYCPTGYQPNMEYCYKLYSEPVTWEEAVATCSAQKGSLTSVTRDEEHYFIFNILHSHTVKSTWLGLNDRMQEGSFSWVDGSPLSFNGWTNPPEVGSQKNCVQLTTDIGWQDVPCDTQNPFVCKTIRPGDLIFMVTIHYPTQPWSQDLVYGTTPAAVELIQRVEKLIMSIYGTRDWFLSYTIKAFRGHVSVFIDIELRFSPTAPIDPTGPLKNVSYTEDCDGFICDLTDVQIVPAINVTYNGTCSPSCYTSCTPNCAPACCSPQTLPTYYTYEVVQVPAVGTAAPPPPPPPVPLQQAPYNNYPSYCANECQATCTSACPPECCSTPQRKRKRKRMEILRRKYNQRYY